MLRTRVIPCLLIKSGKLVKTIKFQNPSYVGDPINAIKIFNEKEVDELILLDITATIEKRHPPFELLSQIADECFMPVTYGGGIRSIEDIHKILNLGIEKIVINSYAVENPDFIQEAARIFGSQSIVVAMDVKKTILGKFILYTHGGRQATNFDPIGFAKLMQKNGAGEIFLNSIDRDGTWTGFDIGLIRGVVDVVNIPVIACGGAGSINDFGEAVNKGGASAVAAGSKVVYQGKGLGVLINFPLRDELIKVLN